MNSVLAKIAMCGAATQLVFICHARNDKETVARPLANALAQHDVPVWPDSDQLKIGDSLRYAIDLALSTCTFGSIIGSPLPASARGHLGIARCPADRQRARQLPKHHSIV